MTNDNMKTEIVTEIGKAAPPLTVVATSITNTVNWQEIVYILTAIWLAVQIAWFVGVRLYRLYQGRSPDTIQGSRE